MQTNPFEQDDKLYNFFGLRELMTTDLPEPTYVVPNLIAEGLNIMAGTPKCLEKNTDVLTPQGPVPIKDIKVGDLVYGYNEDGSISLTTVLEKHNNGVQQVRQFTHRGRVVVEATPNHRWLSICKRGNEKVRDGKGVSVSHTRVKRMFVDVPLGPLTNNQAYAIGALLGDGCMKQSSLNSIYISGENDLIPQKVANQIGAKLYKQHESNHTWRISNVEGKGSSSQKDNLDLNYIRFMLGTDSHTKTFSKMVLKNFNRASLIAFLAGLIDTDGSVIFSDNKAGKTLKINFSSINPELIELFRWSVYRLFQIEPRVCPNYRKDPKKNELSAIIGNTLDARRILKAIDHELVSPQKKYRSEYDNLKTWAHDDSYSLQMSETSRLAQTYDITIANSTNLYVLANQGLITHNSGKSFLLLKLAAMIGVGGKYLNTNLEPNKVLYLALEDTPYRLKKRILVTKSPRSDNLYFSTRFPQMESPEGIETLRQVIFEHQFKLVIIDTLGRFSVPKKSTGNVYADDTERGAVLQAIGFQFGCAILVVHHLTKGARGKSEFIQQISGSQGLPGAADVILGFQRPFKEDKAQLHIIGRDFPGRTVYLTWDNNSGGWQHVTDQAGS